MNIKHNIKVKPFRVLNLLFWFANWGLMILVNENHTHCFYCFFRHTLNYLTAFFICYLLRYIYIKNEIFKRKVNSIIAIITISSITCALVWFSWNVLLQGVFAGKIALNFAPFAKWFWGYFFFYIYPFLAWNAIYLGYKVYQQYYIQKETAEKLTILAQEAQLEMLRYQLNPHFLFNTLSSLRALIRNKENDIAESVVTKISEFLKYSLLVGEESIVPLSNELKIVNYYFEIEKVRFGDKLQVEYSIGNQTEKCLIPVFLVHSLVENAIKHGMKTSKYPLKISICANIIDDQLKIIITNTGHWIESAEDGTRTGIKNTIKRLELAYPRNHTFRITKNPEFVSVEVSINTIN